MESSQWSHSSDTLDSISIYFGPVIEQSNRCNENDFLEICQKCKNIKWSWRLQALWRYLTSSFPDSINQKTSRASSLGIFYRTWSIKSWYKRNIQSIKIRSQHSTKKKGYLSIVSNWTLFDLSIHPLFVFSIYLYSLDHK